ncbi:hypothetical protein [Dictyobacter aurantiacus]|uniref:Uncharacterized protein n=1 Tax=Dictyobacter aurantiacus TaxID=1936993 RepID=A0A401Z9H2_9CHLR|nr:hypothetical protein [Dictyobacter aurantiacus]GCE03489.1 hypothetical protein KDAU_08180 [Dictyobacter aurantiacus]
MMLSSRPNFFLLLDLDPEEPWSDSTYQKACQDKIRQWDRESAGIAKKALLAQANRALLPQIHQVMECAELRKQEAEEARKILYRRDQEAHARFERQLALLNLKDEADPKEVDLFIQEFKHIMPEPSIQMRITVKVRPADKGDDNGSKPLDASLASNIADRLELIQQKTLYDFLGCSRTCVTSELLARASELYAQEVRLHPTPTTIARVELAGFAITLFKSDEMRARYDETLRRGALQQLLDDLAASMKRSPTRELHPRQVRYYLERAAAAGWSKDEAFTRLKERSRLQQWLLTLPAKDTEWRVENIAMGLRDPFDSLLPSVDTDNVRQIQYRLHHSAIRLYWQWPEGCQVIFLSYRTQPGPLQHYAPDVITYDVTRAEYERRGYYTLSIGNGDQSYHLLISAIVEQDGVRRLSSGVQLHIHCSPTRLTYKIFPPHLLRRQRLLALQMDPPGLLPSLLFVSRSQRPAAQRTDGVLMQRIDKGQTDSRGELLIPLPALPSSPKMFGKLFLEDERLASTILIYHPVPGQMRLN